MAVVYLARDGAEVSAVESQDAFVVDDRFEGSRSSCELLGLHPLLDHLSRNTNKAGSLFKQGRIRDGLIRVSCGYRNCTNVHVCNVALLVPPHPVRLRETFFQQHDICC